MAKRMAEQMELFEPVERGFNEGGDASSAKDTAMQDLQSSAADKTAARKDQFDKLTDMLMSGEIKDMPEEEQKNFIKLYKMMKSQGFNKGGLMDEGGMVDEESGNEVPPGSLREEVRDDIPAQLSEGEFVFPADVVRYIGLENLMRMRQEAKQGLSQMEAMGQMGNSEEATVEDDMPFDMYDLDIDDEGEYNSETKNYQVGGYVPSSIPQQPYNQPTPINPQTGTYTLPGTGIAGYQVPSGGQTGYTPYGGAAPYFQPVQFTGPQYQTALQTTNLPTFAETVGDKPGQYDELRTYVNDAGQILQIPFKDGKPIYPIPEGYSDQSTTKAEETASITPTVGQAQVIKKDDTREKIKTEAYGGPPGSFNNKATQEGLAMFSEEFDQAINPIKNPFSKVNIVATAVGLVNPILGMVARGLLTKKTFDEEIKRLAEDYSFFTEDNIKAELGNLFSSSEDYANAQKAIEDAKNKGDETAQAEAQEAADKARSKFGDSAARMSGATEKQGKAGIEASGVAPGPGAPLKADKQVSKIKDSAAPSGFSGTSQKSADDFAKADVATGKDGGGRSEDKDSGMGGGCFAAGTKFFMQDGSLKSVEDIKVGDIIMDGGKVRLSIVGDGSNSDWYMYGATKVTGSHPVREQGVWKFIRNAENAVPTETENLLYTIVNANHRMVAEDKVVYSDYDMVDEDGIEEELLEMMNLQEVVEEAA